VSEFFKGRVTAFLESQHSQFAWSETEFYLCGNGAMIDDVRKFLKSNGVDRKAIHVEVYFRPEATPERAAVRVAAVQLRRPLCRRQASRQQLG
jgi:ferredoxin-NADP reductase